MMKRDSRATRTAVVLAAGVLIVCLGAFSARADEVGGRVVEVEAGDALTVKFPSGLRVEVRLADIAAPKAGQPYGARSRRSLAELCGGKSVVLENQASNAEGHLGARVMCAGVNANGEQVRRGMAWVDRRYANPTSGLFRLEADAREHRRGLWRRRHPVAPWIWQPRR
jgi:endonuclease YncB( thermonuclease family)